MESIKRWAFLFICLLPLMFFARPAYTQTDIGESQMLNGRISPSGVVYYNVSARQQGERLYVLMRATSDNLDPFVGLLSAEIDLDALRADFGRDMNIAESSNNPVEAIDAVRDQYFLAWDDDGGPGYAAALTYSIPHDGDYYLVLSSSSTTIWEPAFGDYELFISINDPAVLSGAAADNSVLAVRDDTLSPANFGVESISGTLSEAKQVLSLGLTDVQAGDTLNLSIELMDADMNVALLLLDFGGKPLGLVAPEESERTLTLEYTFPEAGAAYSLRLLGCCGDFRLTAGLNAPEKLSGQIDNQGAPVLETAIPVSMGFRLQQITGVDQKEENFGVVGTLRMEWDDPRLAFSADECQCLRKVFTQKNFNSFYTELGDNWPDFTFFNQQGRRDIQNQEAIIIPNGHVIYLERFSTAFQAADFNFRKFPFDSQPFFIHIDGLWSEDLYAFEDDEAFTELGNKLGEDEWPASEFVVTVSSVEATPGILTPRYTFGFEAERNVNFYILRIFVPLIVVIVVSWITFFLKDYNQRIEVATGNLLLFIAFNFTISDDLPRLGYLTFMDVILIVTFLTTALVVVFNVVVKRLEIAGEEELVARVDPPMIWLYPLSYVALLVATTYYFFVRAA